MLNSGSVICEPSAWKILIRPTCEPIGQFNVTSSDSWQAGTAVGLPMKPAGSSMLTSLSEPPGVISPRVFVAVLNMIVVSAW